MAHAPQILVEASLERLRRLKELQTQLREDKTQRINQAIAQWRDGDARPEQLPPEGTTWSTWLYLAGRGSGKTRSAAEWMAAYGATQPRQRLAILAPTFADARDTCVEGESGLLSVLERYDIPEGKGGYLWNRSMGELRLPNWTRIKLFSAEQPARLRGPQFGAAWVDELAQVVRNAPDAWDMLQFGLRLGRHPQVVATTTPLPVGVIRDLLVDPRCVVVRGTTFDNAANLSASALQALKDRYEGTRLGRQELHGEVLDDVPGALWQRAWIDASRVDAAPLCSRIVVAVDPAVTGGEHADETGIVVVGQAGKDFFVLADATLRDTPEQAVQTMLDTYSRFEANELVVEVNNGGDYIPAMIRAAVRERGWQWRQGAVPTRPIHAKRGKRVRAEPVSALYEQLRVHHCGTFPHLEDQMCSWTAEQTASPDRLDAAVYALLHLSGRGQPVMSMTGPGATVRSTRVDGTASLRSTRVGGIR